MQPKTSGIPYPARRYLHPVTTRGSKATPAETRDAAVRALIRAITAADHEGVQARTAKAIGVPPTTLNGYVNGRERNGDIVFAVAAYLGRSVDEVLAANGDLAALRAPRPASGSVEVVFGQLPMWPQLLEHAKTIAPSVPDWCWRDTAESIVWLKPPITSQKVADVALVLLKHTPPHA